MKKSFLLLLSLQLISFSAFSAQVFNNSYQDTKKEYEKVVKDEQASDDEKIVNVCGEIKWLEHKEKYANEYFFRVQVKPAVYEKGELKKKAVEYTVTQKSVVKSVLSLILGISTKSLNEVNWVSGNRMNGTVKSMNAYINSFYNICISFKKSNEERSNGKSFVSQLHDVIILYNQHHLKTGVLEYVE